MGFGRVMLNKAPSYKFVIHNSGGLTDQKTLLKDYTDYNKNSNLDSNKIKNYFNQDLPLQNDNKFSFREEILNKSNVIYCYDQECDVYNKNKKGLKLKLLYEDLMIKFSNINKTKKIKNNNSIGNTKKQLTSNRSGSLFNNKTQPLVTVSGKPISLISLFLGY
jgi:hypothetical protein